MPRVYMVVAATMSLRDGPGPLNEPSHNRGESAHCIQHLYQRKCFLMSNKTTSDTDCQVFASRQWLSICGFTNRQGRQLGSNQEYFVMFRTPPKGHHASLNSQLNPGLQLQAAESIGAACHYILLHPLLVVRLDSFTSLSGFTGSSFACTTLN